MKKVKYSPFEEAVMKANKGELRVPTVSYAGKPLNFFKYQLAVHKYNLSLMSKGIGCRGIKLKDLKWYYGLTKRSAKDCLEEYMVIFNMYAK